MIQKYRSALVLVLATWAIGIQAQFTRTLSPNAIVSLMTVAPGNELYSTFGHSALRIFDPSQNVDRIYNYGTFDFDQPDFYLNFCRGKLLYILDVERYKSFERGNMLEDRGMQEQQLNLTPLQKERLFNLLEDNALAQNRAYKYDFFYDNCATRIRDIVDKTLFGQVTYDSAHVDAQRTMRQLLRSCLTDHPWTGVGIDLVLGMPTDKVAGVQHYVFLPDNLHDAFAKARLPEGAPLVKDEYHTPAHYTPVRHEPTVPLFPVLVMSIVALLGLACMFNSRANRIFDGVFWFVLGLGGLIIAFLWFFTDHQATKNNLNLFWMLPSHLLVFWRKRRENLLESYFMVAGIISAGMLLAMKWLPQELPLAAIPLMVLITIKGFWRGR